MLCENGPSHLNVYYIIPTHKHRHRHKQENIIKDLAELLKAELLQGVSIADRT